MKLRREKGREKKDTREVANGDGNTGNCDEAKVIEGAEVTNDCGKRRVPIYHWVLWLRRCCDICVHLSRSRSHSLSLCFSLHSALGSFYSYQSYATVLFLPPNKTFLFLLFFGSYFWSILSFESAKKILDLPKDLGPMGFRI